MANTHRAVQGTSHRIQGSCLIYGVEAAFFFFFFGKEVLCLCSIHTTDSSGALELAEGLLRSLRRDPSEI